MEGKVQVLEVWHPIDGKWAHILQVFKDGITTYYTNGKLARRTDVIQQPNTQIKIFGPKNP